MKHLALILLALIGLSSCSNNIDAKIVNACVEQQVRPQALATNEPHFSWQYESSENNVVQQDYRIIVASTAENAQRGIGDLWDSKTVASNQMLNIPMLFPYTFEPLRSRDRAYWKVITTVTANGGRKTKVESEVQYFEISLLLQLEVTYKDGSKDMIVSDETWRITNRGPIRTANEWDGETYDENYELGEWNQAGYDASAWLPGRRLPHNVFPNIRLP